MCASATTSCSGRWPNPHDERDLTRRLTRWFALGLNFFGPPRSSKTRRLKDSRAQAPQQRAAAPRLPQGGPGADGRARRPAPDHAVAHSVSVRLAGPCRTPEGGLIPADRWPTNPSAAARPSPRRSTTRRRCAGPAGATPKSSGSRSRRPPPSASGRATAGRGRGTLARRPGAGREHLPPEDLRVATSVANVAVALRWAGQRDAARRTFAEALALWDGGGRWVESLKPTARARSSTFHLRLEARHADTYRRFPQQRYRALAEEGRAILLARRDGAGDASDRLARWRRERPAGFNDWRRLLGAVLLIAAGASEMRSATRRLARVHEGFHRVVQTPPTIWCDGRARPACTVDQARPWAWSR